MVLEPDEIGQFIDAFLADHGRIHVGEEQPLGPAGDRLHHDVEGEAGKGAAQVVGEQAVVGIPPRCERNVGGDARVENRRGTGAGQSRRGGGDGVGGQNRIVRMGDEGRDVGQDEVSRKGHRPRAVLIAGPTASGKSALALDLARRFGGVVINADSMQVYRDLAIITARPSAAETGLAPHRLYGTVDAAETFSVGRWVEAAGAEIAAALAAGALPILVGGTGLYFKALTTGLSAIPQVSPAVRERVRQEAAGRSAADLHASLAARDPATAARLRPSDPQRILRAIEVLEGTGRPLLHWQEAGREAAVLAGYDLATVFLTVEREMLRTRIDRRFEVMMASGALAEVEALAMRRLDPALPAMRAHGVPGLVAHLAGDFSLAEAVARGQRDTRAYAKRQETWFRNQMPEALWLTPAAAEQALAAWLDAARAGPFPAGSTA